MNILRLALGDSKSKKGGRKRKLSCTPSYITGNKCLKMKLSQVERPMPLIPAFGEDRGRWFYADSLVCLVESQGSQGYKVKPCPKK